MRGRDLRGEVTSPLKSVYDSGELHHHEEEHGDDDEEDRGGHLALRRSQFHAVQFPADLLQVVP